MSEFDDLVSRKGVLVAGRFGPDWSVAEQKSAWLVIEEPKAIAMISSFCASIQNAAQHDGACDERRYRGELAAGERLGGLERRLLVCDARRSIHRWRNREAREHRRTARPVAARKAVSAAVAGVREAFARAC